MKAWRIAGWSLVAFLLLAPMVAMRFTEEVNWTRADFSFAAVMLVGSGLLLELAVRRTSDRSFRAGAMVAIFTALSLVWITGAVGIIGNEQHPANLLYLAVLATAAGGALWARFCAAGLSRAMLGAAMVHAAIGVCALWADWGPSGDDAWRTGILNAAFVSMWLLASGLFHRASPFLGDKTPPH